ncbi:MAG TPA: DUF1223 domain-containing protein [Xanthobacteraceae bacterium]|nr:DUF1223 domain-containing protein [Xanthobacteraceae bacterium]
MVSRSLAIDCLTYAVIVVCSSAVPHSSAQAEPRAVIELFTSQGCSSCPAADKLLGELAGDPTLVAMSLPVDYWDYLGWKDTLAQAGHSKREHAYARVRGDGQVYTPQIVVNGTMHVLGSDKDAIEHAIAKTRKSGVPLSLPVTLGVADDNVTVNVPAGKAIASEVWLCPITKAIPIAIGRGENRGRTVTYYNVVRRWLKLGEWNGTAESWKVPVKDLQTGEIDSVAVMVQAGKASSPGPVLGAVLSAIR